MEETEQIDLKLYVVVDVCNEIITEYESTDIVSKNNFTPDKTSTMQNREYYLRQQKLLKECLQKGIFLEGLITSVLIDNSSLADIFEFGITKAANFSELGDIQTVLSAVIQWCTKLHTNPGKNRSQQAAWLHKNGFKEATFKEIDRQLHARYTEVIELISEMKKPILLNFNKDVRLVHETMMEIMAELWHDRLCIYQGHKDLGYMQISSKVSGLIGRKSCYRLTNEPPKFVLALDALTQDHIPEEMNLLVSIGEDLVASILSKYHNTTPTDMVDQFFCIPVATEYMGFELGSLASSETFCKRLKLICGHVIKVLYDRDLKQLNVLGSKAGCDRVKSVLEEELTILKLELEKKELEIPFPNLTSPLRMQIGEGLQCFGITGFQWFVDNQLREVHIRKCACTPDSLVAEIYATYEEDKSCMCKRKIKDLCMNQQLSPTENAIEYECYTQSFVAKQTNILADSIVVFDSSVEVILNCVIKDRLSDETNGDALVTFRDAKAIVVACVIRAFTEIGLRVDGRENSTAIWAEATSQSPNQFELKIIFPNVHTASAGAKCLEGISSSSFSVYLRRPKILASDLKTISIMITKHLYHVIEKPLEELLYRMQERNVVESWIMQDSSLSANHSNSNLHVLVRVTATENRHMRSLTQTLETFFQPANVTFDNLQLNYLHSNDGTKFLKLLMHLTQTYIHLAAFQKEVKIYGAISNKIESARILKRQLAALSTSSELSWHLFDFDKTCFNPHALKIVYHNIRSHLDKLKCNSDISQYFLFEDRPELWLETKTDVFSRYSEEIRSTLLQKMDVAISPRKEFVCSVCWSEDLEASSKDCYLLSVCGHAYCKECILQLLIQSTTDRNLPIKCVLRKCDKALSVAELWYICGIAQYCDIRKILRGVLNNFVAQNAASFGLCLRRKCGAMCVVYEEDKMKTCLLCQGRFCLQCDNKFHGTMACHEVWNVKDWLKEDHLNRKRCPNCRIAIHREYGCNSVFCAWCANYICFTCGKYHTKISKECYAHIDRCR